MAAIRSGSCQTNWDGAFRLQLATLSRSWLILL
jgi:hypothetical protein